MGREQDVRAAAERLLDERVRLLTLIGPGGSGKTRLAVAVAESLQGTFEEGAWFIDLAPLDDPSLLVPTLARVLGIAETTTQPLLERVQDAVGRRRMLLVLDNFEHLMAGAPLVVDLLQACDRVKLLVTSREPLRVRWERQFPVQPLRLPDLDQLTDVQSVAASPAIRLFVERAQDADPDFELTVDNARAVADLCAAIDGLPLAIELAAARVGVLPVESMRTQIPKRLDVLAPGARDAPPRHSTLRATIAWSVRLLDESEQRLFRRLAVFAGGFTLEAAQEVCRGTAASETAVLNGLASLVAKNLVARQVDTPGGRARFRMLETVRAYALEGLTASEDRDEARARHAAYFTRLAEHAEPGLWGPELSSPQRYLEHEHDNFRTALRWLVEQGETAAAQQLGGTLARFWQMSNYLSEGRTWLAELLTLKSTDNDRQKARMLVGTGLIASYQGDYAVAHQALTEGLGISRQVGDCAAIRHASFGLALMAWLRGDYAGARRLADRARVECQASGHRVFEALNLFVQAAAATDMADIEHAEQVAHEALRLCRAAAFGRGIGLCLCVMGRIAHQKGQYAEARLLLQEALERFRTDEFPVGLVWSLGVLGLALVDAGEVVPARGLLVESLRLARHLGLTARLPWVLEGLAQVTAAQGRPEDAVRLVAAADAARTAHTIARSPAEELQLERWLPACRRALGAGAAAAWASGEALTLDEVVARLVADRPLGPRPRHVLEEGAASPSGVPLTAREREVVSLVARGFTNRQIAQALVITERTAEGHVERIRGKLGYQSRTQVAAWAVEHGLAIGPRSHASGQEGPDVHAGTRDR